MNRLIFSSHLLGNSLQRWGVSGVQKRQPFSSFSSFQTVGLGGKPSSASSSSSFFLSSRPLSLFGQRSMSNVKVKPSQSRQDPRELILYSHETEKTARAIKFRGCAIAALIVVWGAFGYFTYDILSVLTQRTKNLPLMDTNEVSERSKIMSFYASIYRSIKKVFGGDDSSPIVKQSTLFSFVQGMMALFFPLIGALFVFGHKTVAGHQVHKLAYCAPSSLRIETYTFFGGRQFREISCRDIEAGQYLPTPEGVSFRVSGDMMSFRVDKTGRISQPALLKSILSKKLDDVNLSVGVAMPPSPSLDPKKVDKPPKFRL